MNEAYAALDAWIDQHFDEQVEFLQALVRVPTDTPPGNNAPHAERTAELLHAMGLEAERHVVPEQAVKAYGLQSITNLIVRRPYQAGGPTIALNAHGDVVPPGEGWTHDPYGAQVVDGTGRTLTAADGRQGLAAYLSHRSQIRLVIVDLMMPELSGTAAIQALRAKAEAVLTKEQREQLRKSVRAGRPGPG